MKKLDSAELYQLCRKGNPDKQAEGYQLLGQILFHAARKQLDCIAFDDNFVSDCTQDSLISIWKKLNDGEGFDAPDVFIAWAVRIVKNKCIDAVRKTQRRHTFSLDNSSDYSDLSQLTENIPEKESLKNDTILTLTNLILDSCSLSENEKILLCHGYLASQTDSELARMLNTTDANIKVIRHRALKKIRNNDELIGLLRRLI